MVDKIDRTDPVNKYDVIPTKETHDEGQKKQDDRREEDDEYSSPGTEISWNKYRISSPTRHAITLARSDIRQAIFRQAMLQSRTVVLEMDLILTNGETLPRAQFVSSNMDDYWKWKGWVPGQVMPLDLMVQESILKLSIQELKPPSPTSRKAATPEHLPAAAQDKPFPWHTPARELNWLWIAKVGAAFIVGLWFIGKLARWW